MEREQIADAVRDWLEQDDWKYDYNAEDQLIRTGLRLNCKLKSVDITVLLHEDSYTVYQNIKISGDPENLTELCTYLTMANYGLRAGNFELDMRDGEVRYKTYVNCEGLDSLPEEIIRESIYVGCAMMERYGNGIAALALGFSDAKTEIEKAEGSDDESSDDDTSEE